MDDTDDWEDAKTVAMAVCRSLADAAAVAYRSITHLVLPFTQTMHFCCCGCLLTLCYSAHPRLRPRIMSLRVVHIAVTSAASYTHLFRSVLCCGQHADRQLSARASMLSITEHRDTVRLNSS